MSKTIKPCHYSDYLGLDKLLTSQQPVAPSYGKQAHDEMLFIIVHQAYELWFKQILHELHSVYGYFGVQPLPEKLLGQMVARLERVTTIQTLLIDQIKVMETMTPLDFLDFRDFLVPASGFQSIQFKELEILLGLKSKFRINFDQDSFYTRLNDDEREHLIALEQQPSLFDHVESWLERMPFLQFGDFDFWRVYQHAVDKMLNNDRQTIEENPTLSAQERQRQLADWQRTRDQFTALLDEDKFAELKADGVFRFNQRALLAALFIHLYRDEPILQLPFKLLTCLLEIDERFTTWRYRHVIMVQRMLGTKIGTGGSSGHDYLRQTTENNRFFKDLFALSTFLLPRSALPELPSDLLQSLNFFVGANTQNAS